MRLLDGISHLPVLVVSQVGRVMPRLDVDYVCGGWRVHSGDHWCALLMASPVYPC